MSELMALSIVTGVLCGFWAEFAPVFGLLAWAGFAGCTTYFASGKHGIEGFKTSVIQNLFGVLCGMIIILLSTRLPFKGDQILYSGFLTFIMCIFGKVKRLSFIPGTFIGCFSTFASNGDYKVLIPTLIIGAFLGVCCDLGGKKLYKLVSDN